MKVSKWIAAVGLVAVVGCAPEGPDGAAGRPDTLVIGVQTDVQSWNPYLAEDATNEEILSLIYPTLVIEQVDYHEHPPTFEPSLAKSWEWSEDGLELTFHLDRDAVWSDGVPVTTDDLLFSWEIQTSEELGWIWGGIADSIDSVEAIDSHTMRYTFSRRYPYQLMDVNDGPIVPAHAWREYPIDSWMDLDWSDRVLSAGPYTLAEVSPQQEFVLEKNPRYRVPGQPRIDRLVFRVVPSKANLYTQLLAGGIDLVTSIPPAEAGRVASNSDLQLTVFADRSYTHVIWNQQRELFADPRVRRALAMAIDRETLIDVVYNGFATPSLGPVLSRMWAFNHDLAPVPYDPEGAVGLLAEAGWTKSADDSRLERDGAPFSFEILAPSESDVRQDVALLISRDLERIGIQATPRFIEWGAVQAELDGGQFDAFINRWLEPTQVDLEEIWHSVPPDVPTFNYGHYSNAEVDRLLEQAAAAPDFKTQKPILDRIQSLIVADQPYAFLVENTRLTGLNSRVKNADINDATIFFNIAEWEIVE